MCGRVLMSRMRQTDQNRIQSFAFILSMCAAVCLCVGFIANLRAVEPSVSRYEPQLQNRINPNDAPVESLMRLPGLGAGRAGAIVAYRENFIKKNGKSLAFEDCNDLLKISGIGPKTVQSISEWLEFD
jgi:competence ComEA-like helix-hairpin-helix protein